LYFESSCFTFNWRHKQFWYMASWFGYCPHPMLILSLRFSWCTLPQYCLSAGGNLITKWTVLNPNPHFFIAITKAAAREWKDPLLPHPLHTAQPCGGKGAGGCFLWSPEELLNKNGRCTKINIKSTWKMTFLLKTSATKKFPKIFCEAFLILKKIFCLRHPGLILIQNKGDL
jgi:hypothetical protein